MKSKNLIGFEVVHTIHIHYRNLKSNPTIHATQHAKFTPFYRMSGGTECFGPVISSPPSDAGCE